jgi:hypothetical protein
MDAESRRSDCTSHCRPAVEVFTWRQTEVNAPKRINPGGLAHGHRRLGKHIIVVRYIGG